MTTLSLAAVLAEGARRHADKTAVIDPTGRVTYRDLWQRALALAAGLRERGIGKGDHVAIQIPNLIDFPAVYYAVLAVGAAVVPVNLLLTPDEIAYVLTDSEAKLLVAHASQLATGAAAGQIAGVPVVSVGPAVEGVPSLTESATPLRNYETVQAEDVAVVFYTSGTTGKPKGALLTHLNLVMNTMIAAFDANEHRENDVSMGCLPLFHTFGQTSAMNAALRIGGTLVLLPRFTGEAAIDLMVREQVTIFYGVPTMYLALLEAAPKAERLPELRVCVSGGASLPVAVLERFEEVFQTKIYEGYGLSETSPTASVNQPAYGTRAGSVGHSIWGVDVEVARPEIDERIELMAPGELGEIVVRGHNVFAGYLNNPEASAQALVDGWFRTGDLGTVDEQGFITIVDRKKDLVIRGGFNIYPREVEETLARHPAVQQVAVIGVPDPRHGEEVCAVVVADPGGVTAKELIDWSKERLGKHKYPRQIRFVESLPLGPSFKVLKRELRKTYGTASPAEQTG